LDSKEIIKPTLWEIEDLNEEIRKCKKCKLWKTRTNVLLYNNSLREEMINNIEN